MDHAISSALIKQKEQKSAEDCEASLKHRHTAPGGGPDVLVLSVLEGIFRFQNLPGPLHSSVHGWWEVFQLSVLWQFREERSHTLLCFFSSPVCVPVRVPVFLLSSSQPSVGGIKLQLLFPYTVYIYIRC